MSAALAGCAAAFAALVLTWNPMPRDASGGVQRARRCLAGARRALARVLGRADDRAGAVGVAELCREVAAELRVGRDPVTALAESAREWPALGRVIESAAVGVDVATALRRLASESGVGEFRFVAAAWQVSRDSGQGLADALDRVADDLAAHASSRRVIDSELASARATARLVAALGPAALVMGIGAGADPLGFLFGTPIGWACGACGVVLLVLGVRWIEHLAARALR